MDKKADKGKARFYVSKQNLVAFLASTPLTITAGIIVIIYLINFGTFGNNPNKFLLKPKYLWHYNDKKLDTLKLSEEFIKTINSYDIPFIREIASQKDPLLTIVFPANSIIEITDNNALNLTDIDINLSKPIAVNLFATPNVFSIATIKLLDDTTDLGDINNCDNLKQHWTVKVRAQKTFQIGINRCNRTIILGATQKIGENLNLATENNLLTLENNLNTSLEKFTKKVEVVDLAIYLWVSFFIVGLENTENCEECNLNVNNFGNIVFNSSTKYDDITQRTYDYEKHLKLLKKHHNIYLFRSIISVIFLFIIILIFTFEIINNIKRIKNNYPIAKVYSKLYNLSSKKDLLLFSLTVKIKTLKKDLEKKQATLEDRWLKAQDNANKKFEQYQEQKRLKQKAFEVVENLKDFFDKTRYGIIANDKRLNADLRHTLKELFKKLLSIISEPEAFTPKDILYTHQEYYILLELLEDNAEKVNQWGLELLNLIDQILSHPEANKKIGGEHRKTLQKLQEKLQNSKSDLRERDLKRFEYTIHQIKSML